MKRLRSGFTSGGNEPSITGIIAGSFILAEEFGSLDALRGASEEEMRAVDRIGPEAAGSVRTFFDEPANRKDFDRMSDFGVKIEAMRSLSEAVSAAKRRHHGWNPGNSPLQFARSRQKKTICPPFPTD